MINAFLNASNSRNIDLKELNPIKSDEQDVVNTSSGIRLPSQIFVSIVIFI